LVRASSALPRAGAEYTPDYPVAAAPMLIATVVAMVAAVGVAIEVARPISMTRVGIGRRGASNCDERNHCGGYSPQAH
jgi:hypothetical protein